mmetsp:Transcript_5757/g.17141  ORF Transcript_5757/g.17141 Transcript_5757/m.17141 type:complete len:234 (+) Transcript_5757:206-907(+)
MKPSISSSSPSSLDISASSSSSSSSRLLRRREVEPRRAGPGAGRRAAGLRRAADPRPPDARRFRLDICARMAPRLPSPAASSTPSRKFVSQSSRPPAPTPKWAPRRSCESSRRFFSSSSFSMAAFCLAGSEVVEVMRMRRSLPLPVVASLASSFWCVAESFVAGWKLSLADSVPWLSTRPPACFAKTCECAPASDCSATSSTSEPTCSVCEPSDQRTMRELDSRTGLPSASAP